MASRSVKGLATGGPSSDLVVQKPKPKGPGPAFGVLGFCSLGPVRVPTLTKLEPKAMYLLVVPQGMSLCNMTSVSATVWRQRGLNQSFGFP